MQTPWGPTQQIDRIADGVLRVYTASHGGFRLDEARNAAMPEALRNYDGWYEEDVEWALVVCAFGDLFDERLRNRAPEIVREWFPDRWSAHTGETVTAEDSHVVAQREFAAAHCDDLVTVSAIGKTSWNDVPDGKVLVAATVGGVRTSSVPRQHFYVDADAYNARSQFGYIIDPTVDVATDETI